MPEPKWIVSHRHATGWYLRMFLASGPTERSCPCEVRTREQAEAWAQEWLSAHRFPDEPEPDKADEHYIAGIVSERTGRPRKQIETAIDTIFATIAKGLEVGDVEIRGFGRFLTWARDCPHGIAPVIPREGKTTERIMVKIKPAPALKALVDASRTVRPVLLVDSDDSVA